MYEKFEDHDLQNFVKCKNIKFINVPKTYIKKLERVKFRSLIYYENFQNYFTKYNSNDENDWMKDILYYKNSNEIYIYFKKYYIHTINSNTTIDENLVNNIIQSTINTIKKKNIKLWIKYINSILKTNIDNIPNILLDFSINNEKIIFYMKNTSIGECNISELSNNISSIVNTYHTIKQSKRKIIMFCCSNIFEKEEYISDLVEHLFKNGYWLDFYHSNRTNKIWCASHIKYYLYYDIIIYEGSNISNFVITFNGKNLNMIKNKMIIVLPYTYSWDLPITFMDFLTNLKKTDNSIIYYGRRGNDYIESHISGYQWLYKPTLRIALSKYFEDINKIGKHFDCPILIYNKNNDSLLDRLDFFKIHNLDTNKKLVTIFIEWPQVFYYELGLYMSKNVSRPGLGYMEHLILNNNFLTEFIKNIEKNGYNVIIKTHPRENIHFFDNNMYVNNYIKNDDYNKGIQFKSHNGPKCLDCHNNAMTWGINYLIENFKIIDNSFHPEIYKYTDFGVIFSTTSIGWFNYLFDFPIMSISTREKEKEYPFSNWFTHLTKNPKNKYGKEIWNNWFNYLHENNINVDENKIFDIKDLYYGEQFYWEDIINNLDNTIKNFFEKDHKKNFKYFDNNPFYYNTYSTSQEDIGDIIIDLIENNKNLKNTEKDINYIIHEDFLTIYEKQNINVKINNNEITIDIINEPKISYGVNFEVSYYKNNCELNFSFECKIEKSEDNIVPNVYTGKEWILFDKNLTNDYTVYSITTEFDFKSRSRWRISTTSKLIGQQIYIKNITFLN